MGNQIQEPPADLSERAVELWREVVGTRAKSKERIALVQEALEALTRADQARESIAVDGLVIDTGKDMKRLNPAVRIEKDSSAQFARIWGQLNFAVNWKVDK